PERRKPVGRSGPPRTSALEVLEDRTLLSGLAAFDLNLSGLALSPSAYDPSHVLVKFRDAPVALPGTSRAQALGLVPGLREVQLGRLSGEQALPPYRAAPRARPAEPDSLPTSAAVPNDPKFADHWGLRNTTKPGADIHATQAWDVTH